MEHWLVAYDITDDRRRARLARVLDDFGDRMQYSVFEIFAKEKQMALLEKLILEIIDRSNDKVRFYPLCSQCLGKVYDLGVFEKAPFDEPDVIIV